MLFLLNFFFAFSIFATNSVELNLIDKKTRSFDQGEVSFLLKNAALVNKFHKNSRINPLYFVGKGKIEVEICEDHFPEGSSRRKELVDALKEYEKIPFGKIRWKLENVQHRHANEIISKSINLGTLRIDYVDADAYPNDCKKQGKDASWILTQCDYSILAGWNKKGLSLDDGGAILINSHKYCQGSVEECGKSYPKKQVFMHELGHFFGMAHSNEWPKELQLFSSVMGAFQDYLTAFDMKYMQKYYGDLKEDKATKENLVVSGRVKGNGENFKTGKISEVNPVALYLDKENIVKDCKTNKEPRFQFGLFNRSGKMFSHNKTFVLELMLKQNGASYPLVEIPVSKFSPYSEAHFSTTIPKDKWPLKMFNNQISKLQFLINIGQEREISRHELNLKLKLYSTRSYCSK